MKKYVIQREIGGKICKSAFTLAEGATHEKFCAKSAFTLAEVLITLGIIGIVAAMTLPALLNNNRNKQLEAGLKRAYSLIGQALDLYQAETGERIIPENIGTHELKPILIKYFKTARNCGYGTDSKSCVTNYNYYSVTGNGISSEIYRTFNGKGIVQFSFFDDGQFVLNDGSLVLLENSGGRRLYISVDVNGYKKNPNRLGQDLFMFQIDEKGTLLPMGVEGTYYYDENDAYCSGTSTNTMNGAGSTYKALTEKDYFNNLPK